MVSVVCVGIVSGGGFLSVHRDVLHVHGGGECDVVVVFRGGGGVVVVRCCHQSWAGTVPPGFIKHTRSCSHPVSIF